MRTGTTLTRLAAAAVLMLSLGACTVSTRGSHYGSYPAYGGGYSYGGYNGGYYQPTHRYYRQRQW